MRSQINLVLEEAEQRLKHRLEDQAKQLNEGHMVNLYACTYSVRCTNTT